MNQYDSLFDLYREHDARRVREHQEFVDVFPPVDSRTALEHWQEATEELDRLKEEIRQAFEYGETYAAIAAYATRDQAFTALDLYSKHGRAVNALVLDVDETLRSAGRTDNEIPRDALHLLTEFHGDGIPIVVCTGQTLENVKGFMIQGLGNRLVHSGSFSIVYEGGTGVFTPGHGADTKRLLYEDLDQAIRRVFDDVRSRALTDTPDDLRRHLHLQGNEFNATLKPNFETGSRQAVEVIDRALVYLLDLLGDALVSLFEDDPDVDVSSSELGTWTRAYFADQDPEIRAVLEAEDATPDRAIGDAPDPVVATLERIDVGYYEGDAAEITSRELNKPRGVEAAFDVLGVEDPFALVMGDSKSDLRVMEMVAEKDWGISAAPDHSSRDVLDHVIRTDELVFDRGKAADVLRIAYAMNRIAEIS
jgi:hydroxymethylpyrimidine pyrophosphatase-like HAD family hydrolase